MNSIMYLCMQFSHEYVMLSGMVKRNKTLHKVCVVIHLLVHFDCISRRSITHIIDLIGPDNLSPISNVQDISSTIFYIITSNLYHLITSANHCATCFTKLAKYIGDEILLDYHISLFTSKPAQTRRDHNICNPCNTS